MKIYNRAPQFVNTRASNIIHRFHPDHKTAGTTVDFLFVSAGEDEPAVMLHGHACYATIRITSAKERALGHADAEMLIDKAKYEEMTSEVQDALLDHEIYHLEVAKDKYGAFEVDDHRRPKLKMRMHDREFGWFDAIAKRHGGNSIEVQQARLFHRQAGQVYFEFDDSHEEAPNLH